MTVEMGNPKVYLIDDDASHLRAAARLLRLPGFEVIAYKSAAGFLAGLTPDTAGCIVTDLRMPDIDGVELQRRLGDRNSPLPVVFLTGHGDIPASVHAMRHGAEDFLTKDAPKEDLIHAVNRAFARNARERKEHARLSELQSRLAELTPREHEVMRHVVQGKMNKQIAADLDIGERTVKLHRTAVKKKLDVSSTTELTAIWMQVQDIETNS
jgi:FixJ family two-component response regulator